MPIFSFPDDNLSKCQGILTKLNVCIDMKEIWFGITNGEISPTLTELSARDTMMVGYYSLMFLFASALPWSKYYRLDLVSIYQYIKTYHKSDKKNEKASE